MHAFVRSSSTLLLCACAQSIDFPDATDLSTTECAEVAKESAYCFTIATPTSFGHPKRDVEGAEGADFQWADLVVVGLDTGTQCPLGPVQVSQEFVDGDGPFGEGGATMTLLDGHLYGGESVQGDEPGYLWSLSLEDGITEAFLYDEYSNASLEGSWNGGLLVRESEGADRMWFAGWDDARSGSGEARPFDFWGDSETVRGNLLYATYWTSWMSDVGAYDSQIRIFDLEAGVELDAVHVEPTESTFGGLAVLANDVAAAMSNDGEILLYNLADGATIRSLDIAEPYKDHAGLVCVETTSQ